MKTFKLKKPSPKSMVAIFALLLLGIVGVTVALHHPQTSDSQTMTPSGTHLTPTKASPSQISSSAAVSPTSPTTTPSQTTTTQSSTSKPAAATPSTTVVTPAPGHPQLTFAIKSAVLNNASVICYNGETTIHIDSAYLTANSTSGSPFTWRFDVIGYTSDYYAGAKPTLFPTGQMGYYLFDSPGNLFNATGASDGDSVRLHIVSPNDVTSDWFTVPAGSNSKCQAELANQ